MKNVIEKFLRYAAVDTGSDEYSETTPSTAKQFDLAEMLYDELVKMGAEDVFLDRKNCCVYAALPATDGGKNDKVLGFISHMDTSPEASGANVKPRIIENYDGNDIILNETENIILSPEKFPELSAYVGKRLIVTDGTTLLGADDKAGVAEIMTVFEYLLAHPEIPHGRAVCAFTPDEEIGRGTDFFDLDRFGADYAYTVDGGAIGQLEYETFNAASAEIIIHGVNVHTGEAKNKMKNASQIAMEFEQLLPEEQKPEYTEGYEGFFHLMHMNGDVEKAELSYLIRDHSAVKFAEKKKLMEAVGEFLNTKYGSGTAEVHIKDTYYNMREKIEPQYMFLIENAEKAMKKFGVEPIIAPIRGGTDGASLSYKGLPCPNLCTGGHNFHSRYEYACADSMEIICGIIKELIISSF